MSSNDELYEALRPKAAAPLSEEERRVAGRPHRNFPVPTDTKSKASMGLGLGSIAGMLVFGIILGVPLAASAIVLGHLGISADKKSGAGTGIACTGLITWYIVMAWAILGVIVLASYLAESGSL